MNSRIRKLVRALHKSGIDSFLVSAAENVFYLTGFKASNASLLITPKAISLITDFRYREKAKKETHGLKLVLNNNRPYAELIRDLIAKEGLTNMGFESHRITHNLYTELSQAINPQILRPTIRLVENLRIIKDQGEIRSIKKGIEIARQCMHEIANNIHPGMTEREVQARLEYAMKRKGSENPAFDTIIASATKSSMPHALTDDTTRILYNNLVLIDMGCIYGGYHTDLTRPVFTGKIRAQIKKIYDTVLKAQELGIKKVKPGIPANTVDQACRNYISERGFGKCFGHSTGHGVGLEVHEAPAISSGSCEKLMPGMVITIEPGIYLQGRFGIRIEDMVLVTQRGCEVLTGHIPKFFNTTG